MSSNGTCLIYFKNPKLTIDDAEAALGTTLAVTRVGELLKVRWDATSSPELEIWLSREPHVALEVLEIAELHDMPGLGECDARFEIMLADVEEVLDETNTLAEVEMTLQELTQGFIHRSWNGSVSPPPAQDG